MPIKKNICLTLSEETKQKAHALSEKLNISISNLFCQLIRNVKIYNFNSIPTQQINELLKQFNLIESHLYLIRKFLFEQTENNNDFKSVYEMILKEYIDNCHQQITVHIEKINDFINGLNTVKKELKSI